MYVRVCAYCEFVVTQESMLYLYFIDLGSRLHPNFPKVQFFGYVVLEANFHTYCLWRNAIMNA